MRRVTVEFQNGQGAIEKRHMRPGHAIDLLDRLERQQRKVLWVKSSTGEAVTPAEARRRWQDAVGEDHSRAQ